MILENGRFFKLIIIYFDAKGKIVLPSWNDSHTHLVFAKQERKNLLIELMVFHTKKLLKEEGGILNSAKLLEILKHQLFEEQKINKLSNLIKLGTGGIEIKSGYGLSLEEN